MFNCITKSAAKASPSSRILYLYQTHPFSSSSSLNKSVQNPPNQHSFQVKYLINSFGFSPEKALSLSKGIEFKKPHKPDLVVEFFKNHGFTQTQISSLVRLYPRVLVRNAQKNLLPKLEFLKSKGVSSTDVARIVSTCPFLLSRSLENAIIPAFGFLSDLYQSEEKAIAVIANTRSLDQRTRMNPNIATLREIGVADSNIKFLLRNCGGAFMMSCDRFRQVVEKVQKMGFSTSKVHFVVAIKALCSMSKSRWNKTVEVYRKWGLTNDEILLAFKKQPLCMTKSEDKINRVMEFLVNTMGLESSFITRTPTIISMSLEKRIAPRCAVYQALLSKGLIKTNGMRKKVLSCLICTRKSWILQSSQDSGMRRRLDRLRMSCPPLIPM